MSAVLVLMGLLVLAYLGSFLVAGRTATGVGLPSGVEFAALGFVLGPRVLGIVGGDTLAAFEPVVHVAVGWLAFAVGLNFAHAGGKRVRAGSVIFATFSAALTGCAAAAAAWSAAAFFDAGATTTERVLLAGGIGAACAETTRHAVRWVLERHGAEGPLADRLNELAHTDDFLPLLAVACLFALAPVAGVGVSLRPWEWPAVTVAFGLVLGAGIALLVRTVIEAEDTWGLLFGVTLIGIGASARLGLSSLTTCFFAGLATSLLSRHGPQLRAMVAPTERPVLLPALLLAGARLDFRANAALPWIAGAAIVARVAAKIAVGWALAAVSSPARRGGALVGLSLLSSGALAMSIGLAFALRFPGSVGDTVLAVAILSATIGEFVGPVRLRNALQRAGELRTVTSEPPREGLEGAA